jgi:hypothetical protein
MSTQQQVECHDGAKIRHVVLPESSSPWCSGAGTPHRAVEVAHQPEQPSSARHGGMSWGFLRNSHQARSDRHGLEWDDRETYTVLERPRWRVEGHESHQTHLSAHLGACRPGLRGRFQGRTEWEQKPGRRSWILGFVPSRSWEAVLRELLAN